MTESGVAEVTSPELADGRARLRRADARRNLEAILGAAQRLLPEQPQASMGQIATAAGVHRATVHRHFASRDELVAAVRGRAVDASITAAKRVLADPPRAAADRLEAVTAAILESGDQYRLYRFTTWRDEHTLDRSRELTEVMVPLLVEAQQEGEVRADVAAEKLSVAYGGLIVAALPEIAEGAMTVASGAAFIRAMLAPSRG